MFRPFKPQISALRNLHSQHRAAQPLYSLKRTQHGSLPVYSDIRNGGSRYLLYIRNVDGDAQALSKDLSSSLFPSGSPEAASLKIHTQRSRHVVIQGGRWKNQVMDWLSQRGF
ncbi:hypothetical protein E1B28_002541 [Marasmius oreades]|uniref:Large ribosomal subunit protein mL49 n=1 Tax=Marasmius oreades TaxID=181124 RepID=A0A9P7UN73_9AGAR|nr:uncharacterized protein E1B28_002541 [Marasmius oreades]KAG7086596.1 hypothetical protein E1B28_002541 [Marasmius oreades]